MDKFQEPQMTIYEVEPEFNLCASGAGGTGTGGGTLNGSNVKGITGGFD